VHHHPLLASVNLRYALTAVPGLASQTSIPASAVHSMQVQRWLAKRLSWLRWVVDCHDHLHLLAAAGVRWTAVHPCPQHSI